MLIGRRVLGCDVGLPCAVCFLNVRHMLILRIRHILTIRIRHTGVGERVPVLRRQGVLREPQQELPHHQPPEPQAHFQQLSTIATIHFNGRHRGGRRGLLRRRRFGINFHEMAARISCFAGRCRALRRAVTRAHRNPAAFRGIAAGCACGGAGTGPAVAIPTARPKTCTSPIYIMYIYPRLMYYMSGRFDGFLLASMCSDRLTR